MPTIVRVPVDQISDWATFHTVFETAFGFPSFYGRNMNAWIDCMTSLDSPEDEMTNVWAKPGEIALIRIDGSSDFKRRCPEQYNALLDCSAFVNWRRVELGDAPVLGLLFVDKASGSPSPQRV